MAASTRHKHRTRRATALAGLTAASLAITGCGAAGSGEPADGGKPTVVTSTSVWGSVARAVGGDSVQVESIISNAEADPHSYESTPRDAARISDADLIVHNGGGYDSFVKQILSGGAGDAPVIQAVEVAEHGEPSSDQYSREHGKPEPDGQHGHGRPQHDGHGQGHGHTSGNEHVWYRPHVVHKVAGRIADELAKLQPQKARTFHEAAASFGSKTRGLEERVARIKAQHQGTKVIATAPISDPLLERAGLDNITPRSFVQAAESGNDPAAAAIAEIQGMVDSRQAAVLIHNPQTASPLTERIRARAAGNSTPVVEMTETLPPSKTYVEWMGAQVSALEKALNQS